MLKKFKVSNFKNFKQSAILDFGNPSNYEFNSEIIRDNCIGKAMIYGINGSGKSNLALALFDIVLHLTDKQKNIHSYEPYLNLQSDKKVAEFEYTFVFNNKELVYSYKKSAPELLTYESLKIDNVKIMEYSFDNKEGFVKLQGAENLRLVSEDEGIEDRLSRVKYIKSNALLESDEYNKIFTEFTQFVDKMLMFYSLDRNGYQGLTTGSERYTQRIIEEEKLADFEKFLKKHEIKYSLVPVEVNGMKDIYCDFNGEMVPFTQIASTGTKSLALFYYWYLKMDQASFVYIDEFDAFYHFELAQSLVELTKDLPNTQIVMSTHNTDLLSNDLLRPDAYYEIENNKIKPFDKKTEKEIRKAHNMQKMYKAGTFNE